MRRFIWSLARCNHSMAVLGSGAAACSDKAICAHTLIDKHASNDRVTPKCLTQLASTAGGPGPDSGTWETTILPLPFAQDYAPPAHNGDRETHERNHRRMEVASVFPDQSLRNMPDPYL